MARIDRTRGTVAASLCFRLVLCGLVMSGCEAPPKPEAEKQADKPASPSETTTLPAATSAAPKEPSTAEPSSAEQKPAENPAASIQCKPGPNVDFHEPILEDEVRRKLEKPEGPIAVSALTKVKSLNLARDPKAKLDYLDPCVFPHLKNVKDLFLGAGNLSDLSALAKLTALESLRASQNQVEDVSPLAGLKKLDRLDLGRTQVKDVTPLAGLTNLTELQLDNTKVSDVSPLASLEKLERLGLQRSEVKDIAPLKALTKLEFLYIAGARVEDPYALSRPGLKVIDE